MSQDYYILAINPGSTSTKIAVYKNEEQLFVDSIYHNDREISRYDRVWDQYTFRKKEILNFLRARNFDLGLLSCTVGRGGLFKPIVSGTYEINREMLNDARISLQGEHASNLGSVLAYGIGWDYDIPSYIVDPPCVDELQDIARLSGHRKIKKRSLQHALNLKAMARVAAQKLEKPLSETNLIVTHLGGGISVTAILKGRMLDSNNALCAGPFTPERTGSLPIMDFIEYVFENKIELRDAKKMIVGLGGMYSYLGTKSLIEAEDSYHQGDPKAQLVIKAMAYQVAKEIGTMAVVLKGNIDAIVLTGGAAHSELFTGLIIDQVEFLGKILILAGEDELKALAQGALRVLKGEEDALTYPQQIPYEDLFQ